MQAQTINTRRTIRVSWLPLLVAALLVAAVVIGMAIATARDAAPARIVPTTQVGVGVRPMGPHGAHAQPKGAAGAAALTTDTDQGFGSVIGKRLP